MRCTYNCHAYYHVVNFSLAHNIWNDLEIHKRSTVIKIFSKRHDWSLLWWSFVSLWYTFVTLSLQMNCHFWRTAHLCVLALIAVVLATWAVHYIMKCWDLTGGDFSRQGYMLFILKLDTCNVIILCFSSLLCEGADEDFNNVWTWFYWISCMNVWTRTPCILFVCNWVDMFLKVVAYRSFSVQC